MSKALCSQVLWAQVFNLLWFNAVYCEGKRMRGAGSWAERPRWVWRVKAKEDHPVWCGQSDCWPLVIFSHRTGFQRGIFKMRICWRAAEPSPASSFLWAVVPFPLMMCRFHSFSCCSVCRSVFRAHGHTRAGDGCWSTPSWCPTSAHLQT